MAGAHAGRVLCRVAVGSIFWLLLGASDRPNDTATRS